MLRSFDAYFPSAALRASALALLSALALGTSMAQAAQSASEIASQAARDLADHKMDRIVARMSPEMAAALPEATLEAVWAQLAKQVGPFKSLGEAWSEEKDGVAIARAPMNFDRGAVDLKVSIASGQIIGLFIVPHEERSSTWSPPPYADMTKFQEIDVKIGADSMPLPGVLSLPRGVAKAPAAILVHGSGPHDRDETIGPNKVFRDLAFGLASRGVAVLRYDKRTKVYPGSFANLKNSTVKEEVLDDVASAIDFLRNRPEIDADWIVIVGHSLGGALAPRIAAANPTVSRIAILAGAARPLPDIVVEQTQYLASLDGPVSEAEAKSIDELKREAARARAARPGDDGPPFLGVPLSYWADLNAYDPAQAAAALAIPILVLQGDRDYQVTLEDFRRFQSALDGRSTAALHLLPGLNHLFMTGTGRSAPAEYQTPDHVAAAAIDLIADFALAPTQVK